MVIILYNDSFSQQSMLCNGSCIALVVSQCRIDSVYIKMRYCMMCPHCKRSITACVYSQTMRVTITANITFG